MRLTPPESTRLVQATSFEVHFGGAEANVAVSLAQWGTQAVLVSTLPRNPLGESALRFLRGYGVDVSHIHQSSEPDARLGVYYLERGAGLRSSQVLYDRGHTAITTVADNEWNWDEILHAAEWFHWTGITAALGASVRQQLFCALKTAQRLGVRVSCDLNYRQKLWSPNEARATMIPLMDYTDVCVSNEHDARICLNVPIPNSDTNDEFYRSIATSMKAMFGFQTVALSVRSRDSEAAPDVIQRRALLLDTHHAQDGYFSQTLIYRPTEHIGGGDAFTAGLIYGFLTETNSCDALEFAVAAAALKQTIAGDVTCTRAEEVQTLAHHTKLPKVQR